MSIEKIKGSAKGTATAKSKSNSKAKLNPPADPNQTTVVFSFPVEKKAEDIDKLYVVGDFNNWEIGKNQLKKNGTCKDCKAQISLENGKSYQFRYVGVKKDGDKVWFNESDADDQVTNGFGEQNSVINL